MCVGFVSESLLILLSVQQNTVVVSKYRWVPVYKGCGGIVSVCVRVYVCLCVCV